MNGNDFKRLKILEVFFNANRKARNDNMKYLNAHIVKRESDYSIEEINEHITYLLDSGYLKKKTEKGYVRFRISANGMNYFESNSSIFRKQSSFLNIQNNSGVVVVGDNNVVQQKYSDIYNDLEKLSKAIFENNKLTDHNKIELHAEINTIKSQLAKEKPDQSIIKSAWSSLEKLANIEGVTDLLLKLTPLISNLF